MHEVFCPHCGKAFKIDEPGYLLGTLGAEPLSEKR